MSLNIEIVEVYYKNGFCYFPYLIVVDFHLLLNLIQSHKLLLLDRPPLKRRMD